MQDFCILKQDEILILASAFHLKRVYGLTMRKSEEHMVPYRMHEMARNGILHLKEGQLQVNPFYKRVFQSLANANRVVMIQRLQKEERFCWYYIGVDVVCMEESFEDKDAVRISLICWDEFKNVVEEQGMLPHTLLSKELAVLEEAKEVETKQSLLPVCFQYELLWLQNGTVQKQDSFELILSEHNYWLVEKKATGNRLCRYDHEEFYQKIISMEEMIV